MLPNLSMCFVDLLQGVLPGIHTVWGGLLIVMGGPVPVRFE